MSKSKRIVMGILCLLSICVIGMPVFKYLGTTPLSLFNQKSVPWIKTVLVIGDAGVTILKIMFGGLIILQAIALLSIILKKGKMAKFWNVIAGLYETVNALLILTYILHLIGKINDFIGITILDEKAGAGVYAMIFLGIAQVIFAIMDKQKKSGDIFDILTGK